MRTRKKTKQKLTRQGKPPCPPRKISLQYTMHNGSKARKERQAQSSHMNMNVKSSCLSRSLCMNEATEAHSSNCNATEAHSTHACTANGCKPSASQPPSEVRSYGMKPKKSSSESSSKRSWSFLTLSTVVLIGSPPSFTPARQTAAENRIEVIQGPARKHKRERRTSKEPQCGPSVEGRQLFSRGIVELPSQVELDESL